MLVICFHIPGGLRRPYIPRYQLRMVFPQNKVAMAAADKKGAPLVAILDAWTAKRYWPDGDPVRGGRYRGEGIAGTQRIEIVFGCACASGNTSGSL